MATDPTQKAIAPRITAVVPVRAGSQRIKNKNVRPFSDTTLLDLKLEVLAGTRGIDRIVVNTDCDQCEAIARRHGVEVYRRDPEFASSIVTNDQHWRHLAEVTETDIFMMAQVTSPMIRKSTYERAIELFKAAREEHDSLNSVSEEKKFLWQNGRALNYDADHTPKSQDLPDIVSLNFAITIIDRQTMIERANVVGERPAFLTLDKIESIDIDDPIDFAFAEFVYKEKGKNWLPG